MTHSPNRNTPPTAYQIRIVGHLDQYWSPWFGDLTLTHDDDGTTSLTGAISDQAELHGLLTKVRDLGLTLISLEAVGASASFDHKPDSSDAYEVVDEHQHS